MRKRIAGTTAAVPRKEKLAGDGRVPCEYPSARPSHPCSVRGQGRRGKPRWGIGFFFGRRGCFGGQWNFFAFSRRSGRGFPNGHGESNSEGFGRQREQALARANAATGGEEASLFANPSSQQRRSRRGRRQKMMVVAGGRQLGRAGRQPRALQYEWIDPMEGGSAIGSNSRFSVCPGRGQREEKSKSKEEEEEVGALVAFAFVACMSVD